MFSMILMALVFFVAMPLFISRILGWRGQKANAGLAIIAGIYWLYCWWLE